MKILVLGGVSVNLMMQVKEFPGDHPQTIHAERYHETIGSTGAGKSLVLKRLGMDLTFHGVIGDDSYGERIKQRMAAEQIPFVYDCDPNGTERHVNLMKVSGERISIFLQSPPGDLGLDESRIESLISAADVVFLNIAPYCRRFLPLLKKHDKKVWCDLHSYDGKSDYYDDFIAAAHVIQFSSELNLTYQATMQVLHEQGKQLVICTHGGQGASAVDANGQWYETPALMYDVVDTNGAGDNFFAGVLTGQILGHPVETSLRIGTVAAGLCVTSPELIDEELSFRKLQNEYAKHYGTSL